VGTSQINISDLRFVVGVEPVCRDAVGAHRVACSALPARCGVRGSHATRSSNCKKTEKIKRTGIT
jgi:hypothetical protein